MPGQDTQISGLQVSKDPIGHNVTGFLVDPESPFKVKDGNHFASSSC